MQFGLVSQVLCKGLLVAYRLHLAARLDAAVVVPVGESGKVPAVRGAEQPAQRRYWDVCELADGGHTDALESLRRRGTYSPKCSNRQWTKEIELFFGGDHEDPLAHDGHHPPTPWVSRHVSRALPAASSSRLRPSSPCSALRVPAREPKPQSSEEGREA